MARRTARVTPNRQQQNLVKYFFDRKLQNLDLYKDLSIEQLDTRLRALRPRPIFFTQPRTYQKATFLAGIQETSLLILIFLGGGKSKLALDIIAYRKLLNQVRRSLVLVPDEANCANWRNECIKHRPDLKAVLVIGNRKQKLEILNEPADIYILTYFGLQTVLADQHVKKLDPELAKRRIIQPPDVIEFGKKFDTMILDESTMVQNPTALTSQICLILAQQIPYRYLLTGYPFNREPEALWHQLLIADFGATLGTKQWMFMEAFFHRKPKKENTWGNKWEINNDAKPKLHALLRNRSLNYSLSQNSDLPPLTNIPSYIKLRGEALDVYKAVAEDLIKDRRLAWLTKLESHFIRLRQICSGYLTHINDDGERQTFRFPTDKDIILEQTLKNLPDDSKILIYHVYTETGQHIVDKLNEFKYKCLWLYGGTQDKIGTYDEFNNNPDIKILVINVKSGSVGLNLQLANYTIKYEMPVQPFLYDQIIARTYRTGQTKPCFNYDFITENSVEVGILSNLKEGKNLFEEIIQGKGSNLQMLLWGTMNVETNM